jgi:hypothetical protein
LVTVGRLTAWVSGVALVAAAAPCVLRAQDGVGFRASISPDTVYVGQQVNYTLTVRIPADVRQRLRRNPEFVPPEARAMLAYDLPAVKVDPTTEGPEEHVFRRALFPLTPGPYTIPASRLTYALPQSPSFFSREEERTLRSEAVAFVAIDPPRRGRPAGWNGAVGRWSATAIVDGAAARVGDPFVLTLRVSGVGNATLLPRPAIAFAWADIVPEDERVQLDSTPTALAGTKEFAWLVTPRAAGMQVVPVIEYVYFDPGARRYDVTRTSAVSLRVAPGDLVAVPLRAAASGTDTILPLRTALEGARPLALPASILWMWLALLAPMPWAAFAWRRRRPRQPRVATPMERLHALREAPPGPLRALFDDAVRQRTGVRLEQATGPGALSAALRREGVTAETASAAEQLRDTLDRSAYASGRSRADLRERVASVVSRIAAEARRRAGAVLLVLAVAGLATAIRAQATDPALLAFTEGQTAYAGHDFGRARDAFLRAARAAPRDPATWANLGSAAWEAADTASAVLGWQRALRLDPLAGDLRPLLQRVRAPQLRGAAGVWPLPPLPVAALAFVLWCGAWFLLARWSRRAHVRPLAFAVLLPGVALALLALVAETRLRAKDLVVVAASEPLRSLPALGAEAGAMPLVGEVAQVLERRGVWLRIELEAGRTGWFPAERAYALARD